MGHIFKSLLLHDLGLIVNRYVYFYPLNIEHAKLPLGKGGVARRAGVVRYVVPAFFVMIRVDSWFQFLNC
jgi:hypothetical protein